MGVEFKGPVQAGDVNVSVLNILVASETTGLEEITSRIQKNTKPWDTLNI